jgi:hypothetical protein
MGTCKMHQINPQLWLTDIRERIATYPANKLVGLLPGNWILNPTPYGMEITIPGQANPVV